MPLPSGEQFEIADGDLAATITEVGATLRAFRVEGEDLVWGFGPDEMCSGGRGQVLAPWPNRIDGGRYHFGGREVQAALDEPGRNCAIHGLVRWQPWRLVRREPDSVTLAITVFPQPGYPFCCHLEITYTVACLDVTAAGPEVTGAGTDSAGGRRRSDGAPVEAGGGLVVEVSARNQGSEPLPFGIGFHPYLEPGPAGVDGSRLVVPATRQVLLDDRGIPTGEVSEIDPGDEVAAVTGVLDRRAAEAPGDGAEAPGGGAEARGGASPPIGARVLDVCLTGLSSGSDGRWRARFEPGTVAALSTTAAGGSGGPGAVQPVSAGAQEGPAGAAQAGPAGATADWTGRQRGGRGSGRVPIEVWADERFRYCEVFTADTVSGAGHRRGVAVEPMTCPPNAMHSGKDLIVLQPDEGISIAFGIRPLR
ncbi:MAG TPA: aldose 1-epimerase family protein [Acidimicrobiales bacterium]|nr:aldose 1-epimerase family protein [Acidimicrobiales bacterium]